MTLLKFSHYIISMRKFYKFFVLIFTIEKNKSYFVNQIFELYNCDYSSCDDITFNTQELLSVLSEKKGTVLLDCLSAFESVDIIKYKITTIDSYIQNYCKNNCINTDVQYYQIKPYLGCLDERAIKQVMNNCSVLGHDIIKQYNRQQHFNKKRNRFQDFFYYLDVNYDNRKNAQLSDAKIFDIKNFFLTHKKIKDISQITNNNNFIFNYFGSFFSMVISNPLVNAEQLINLLRVIFSNDSLIVDFLFSLNLMNKKSIIFKDVVSGCSIKSFLLQKFASIDSYEKLGNTKINENFNFERCEPDNTAILYLFDNPEFLQQALKYKIVNFTGTQTIMALLNSIRQKITVEHQPRWSEYESFVLSEQINLIGQTSKVIKI